MEGSLLNKLEYLKECKGKEGTKFYNLGRSLYDKINNLIKDDNAIITHLYIPKGSKEKAIALEEDFKEKFGVDIDEELLSFYYCFDGFEFRYGKPREIWDEIEKDELDIDWDEFDIDDPDDISYDDIETKEYQEIKEVFYALINLEATETITERLSDSNNMDDFLFYGESIEEEEYAIKTFIPPADFLLSDENKIQYLEENMIMYLFNFHDPFSQVALGKKDNVIGLYSVTDGQSSINKSDELNIRLHLNKFLIR